MSMSFGSSKKKGTTDSKSNPWEPTIPALTDLVGRLGNYSQTNVGPTSAQTDAFAELKNNAALGNPYEDEIGQLAGDMFGAESRSGQVEEAYADLSRRLGGTADGENLDVSENPFLQKLLQQNGDDIFNRIGGQFSAAGRDITGNAAGLGAVGRGISAANTPTMFNQYNLERQNQMNAANTLFQGGTSSAQTEQTMDQNALATRGGGIAASQAALDAQNYGPNTILNLEQQMKNMPAEDLALYTQLIGSIAGLGGQVKGTSTEKGSNFGIGASNVFGGLGAMAGLLSDERMKEGVDGEDSKPEQVGTLANGTPIYRYKYKGQQDGPAHIGVMAQEVEDDNPNAIAEVGGVKFVDYDEATDDSARIMRRKKNGGGRAYS